MQLGNYETQQSGTQNDKRSIRLATACDNWIRNARAPDRDPQALRAARQIMVESYGVQVRALSAKYNCYGLVFATRRTHVLFEEDVAMILKDDQYRLVERRSDVQEGDVVLYRKGEGGPITHAGLVARIDRDIAKGEVAIFVVSQFGHDGEYLHREDRVPPLLGSNRQYYTHRTKGL